MSSCRRALPNQTCHVLYFQLHHLRSEQKSALSMSRTIMSDAATPSKIFKTQIFKPGFCLSSFYSFIRYNFGIKCKIFPHVGKFLHLIPAGLYCTPRSLSPTLYTPFLCTLPHTFTYRACPSSVHCLTFNALPAEIRTCNHGLLGNILHLFPILYHTVAVY